MSAKKISQDNEDIDLLELVITLWKNKLKIFIIFLLAIIISSYSYINEKPLYTATTEIRQITTFDEFRYETFNLYVDRIRTEKSKELIKNINNKQKDNSEIIKTSTFEFSKKLLALTC